MEKKMKNIAYLLVFASVFMMQFAHGGMPKNVRIIPGKHIDNTPEAEAKNRMEAVEAIQSIHNISEPAATLIYIKRRAEAADQSQNVLALEIIEDLKAGLQANVTSEQVDLNIEHFALNDSLEGEIVGYVQLADSASEDQTLLEIIQRYMKNL
jgi:hypothetical protein